MLTTMHFGKEKENKTGSSLKKKVQPTVVQIGSTLPYIRRDVSSLWVPEPKTAAKTHGSKSVSPRCKKYRNLFEYDILHKNKVDLKKDMWKIPAMSTNILPSKQRLYKPEIGLYEPKFRQWYSRLVHENTIILPPIETSNRKHHELFDSSNLAEKNYIENQLFKPDPLERFERDELHVPDVYSQCYTCAECRNGYVKDVFSKRFATRNNSFPQCSHRGESLIRASANQHCDVLGERYCASCIEERDKRFSKKIENCMIRIKDPRKIHYEKTNL